MLHELAPIAWIPNSLRTKVTYGFNRASEVQDGSHTTLALLDELAMTPGPLKEKVYTLYACGVEGYEGQTFSPKQLASMVIHRNPYKPGDICHWVTGIRTESGIIYGPRYPQKQHLFESLCDTLDLWTPNLFRDIPQSQIQQLRNGLDKNGTSHQDISNMELAVFLEASYAQFTYLLIHPFWNRNGRTSEEMMILFSSSNSARRQVFHENGRRYTSGSATRMNLVNSLASETLVDTLEELGVPSSLSTADTEGYQTLIQKQGSPIQRHTVNITGPYLYRFAETIVGGGALNAYFDLVENKLNEMIKNVRPENFPDVINNPYALRLLSHYLTHGHRPICA